VEETTARRFVIGVILTVIGLILTAVFGVSDFYFNASNSRHSQPIPSKGGLTPPYWYTWNGQIPAPIPIPIPGSSPVTSIQLTLKLGPGGLDKAVGSISSPTFGCGEVVYLARANDPITLRLDTSDSSQECQLLSVFDSATISLASDKHLRFTVDLGGFQESCDLFR
jgi:hypothetical protein